LLTSAAVHGGSTTKYLRLLVDTGSQFTVIPPEVLLAAGYDPATHAGRQNLVSVTGVESVPQVVLDRFSCFGETIRRFLVLSHALPFAAYVDGLLGMDFLRRFAFRIATQQGTVDSLGTRQRSRGFPQ
jgi:predicted aspartyl protease